VYAQANKRGGGASSRVSRVFLAEALKDRDELIAAFTGNWDDDAHDQVFTACHNQSRRARAIGLSYWSDLVKCKVGNLVLRGVVDFEI
jgi:hypothetical protein